MSRRARPLGLALVLFLSVAAHAQRPAVSLSAARQKLEERLGALSPGTTTQLTALRQELDDWWTARQENHPTAREETLVLQLREHLDQAKTAQPKPSDELLARIREELEKLVGRPNHPAPVQRRRSGPNSSRDESPDRPPTPTATHRSATRTLTCAGAFDGAGCGGPSFQVQNASYQNGAPPAAMLLTASHAQYLGSGAHPQLEAASVPRPPSAGAALTAGVGDAIKQQFGTASGLAMNLVGVLFGLLMTVATGGWSLLLKAIGLIAMSAGIFMLLRQAWSAVQAIRHAPDGSQAKSDGYRALGRVGGTLLIMVGMGLIGYKIGKSPLGAATVARMRGALASRVGGAAAEASAAEGAAEAGAAGAAGRTVWDFIVPTDKNWPNTDIPRSFEIEVPSGRFWVHPNATEHMFEFLRPAHGEVRPGDPRLQAQTVLSAFRAALDAATRNGLRSNRPEPVNGWEFEIKQRPTDRLPVVMHAKYKH